jgi:hypothetical protein
LGGGIVSLLTFEVVGDSVEWGSDWFEGAMMEFDSVMNVGDPGLLVAGRQE